MISQTTPLLIDYHSIDIAPVSSAENISSINISSINISSINTNSCIICLEEETLSPNKNAAAENGGQILAANEIAFLIKNCSCQFYIHEKCFNLWFFKKPVCPICTLPIYYQETLYNPLTTYKNGEYVFIDDDRKNTGCMKCTMTVFIMSFFTLFLFNVFSSHGIFI